MLVALAHDILNKKTEFQLNLDEKKVHDSIASIRNGTVVRSWIRLQGEDDADLSTHQFYDEQLVLKIKRKDIQDAIAQDTTTAFTELGKTQVEFQN